MTAIVACVYVFFGSLGWCICGVFCVRRKSFSSKNAKRGKKCSKRGHKKLPAVTVQKKTLPFSHHSFMKYQLLPHQYQKYSISE